MKNTVLKHIEENIKALSILIEFPETCLEIELKTRGAIAAFENMREFVETLEDE